VRFIDASSFIYAFLKPKRPLRSEIVNIKTNAQTILKRVNEGEGVITSVVHVSEIANILEARMPLTECRTIISDIVSKKSVEVVDVSRHMYTTSIYTAERYGVGINDAVAFSIMKERNLEEIYSFDKHFDNMPGIKRVTN